MNESINKWMNELINQPLQNRAYNEWINEGMIEWNQGWIN